MRTVIYDFDSLNNFWKNDLDEVCDDAMDSYN